MKRGFSAERLLPFAAFGGAVLLLASQFMPIFELRSAGDVVQATVTSTDQHWLSMGLFAILAAAAIFGAIWTGSRPLAFTVATCGLVALLLFLLIDLPDAGRTDSVATSAEALVIAEAHPAGGFWIELIGALVLTVCGGAMATLSGEQLRALRPQRRSGTPARRGAAVRGSVSPAPEAQSSSQGTPNPSPRAELQDKERAGGRGALQDTAGGRDALQATGRAGERGASKDGERPGGRGASKDGERGGDGGGSPQRKAASAPKAKAAAKTDAKPKPRPKAAAKPKAKAAAKPKAKAKAPSATPNGNPGAEGAGPNEEAQREERRAKRAARRAEEQAKKA